MGFKSFIQTVTDEVRESVQTAVDSKLLEREIGRFASEYLNSKKLNFKNKDLIKEWITLKICYKWSKAYLDDGFDKDYYGHNVKYLRWEIKALENDAEDMKD